MQGMQPRPQQVTAPVKPHVHHAEQPHSPALLTHGKPPAGNMHASPTITSTGSPSTIAAHRGQPYFMRRNTLFDGGPLGAGANIAYLGRSPVAAQPEHSSSPAPTAIHRASVTEQVRPQ